jgi:membrane associated rhomboid family serine protease
MLIVLGLWIALNAYFGIAAVKIGGEEGSIAWEAHIGGFLCGLLIFGAFDKGKYGGKRSEAPQDA